MKFYTGYDRPKTKAAPSGEKYEKTYEMKIDENGHKSLMQSEIMEPVYEKIQESLEETKIENIVRRALGGDEQALYTVAGSYFDATNAPRSLAEAQQLIIDATEEFYKLPLDVREKFDHSAEVFVHEYGSEEWLQKMNRPQPETEGTKTQGEVTDNG